MTAPACRDCRGTGDDWDGQGRHIACERCEGEGVEFCGECLTRARVVAAYQDTCADGSTYQSQVCAACARRLCGLIETPSPCRACGYVQAMPGWGYLAGPTGPGADCRHLTGERVCPSCSEHWYADGFQSTHDYELVGDPPEHRGGPAKETCPECVAANEADAAANADGEPRVTQVYLHTEPPSAAAALALVLAAHARPVAGDGYLVIAAFDGRAS